MIYLPVYVVLCDDVISHWIVSGCKSGGGAHCLGSGYVVGGARNQSGNESYNLSTEDVTIWDPNRYVLQQKPFISTEGTQGRAGAEIAAQLARSASARGHVGGSITCSCAVPTCSAVSDRCSRGEAQDTSGPNLQLLLCREGRYDQIHLEHETRQ